MKENRSKVVIVGAGNVGCTLAYTILCQSLCNEIVLIDLNQEKTYGEVLDMQHASYFMEGDVQVKAGDYQDSKDADIVVITASAPMNRDAKDRTEMFASSKKIMKSIVSSVMDNGFKGILVVVSNPLDAMTYYAWKLSGLDHSKVIGSGTLLDSARLCKEISQRLDVNSKSVQAQVLGEHGATEMIPWSLCSIGGEKLDSLLKDEQKSIEEENIHAGFEILRRKGNTSYGIAGSVGTIIKAILKDENKILPVSSYVDGYLGIKGCYLSLPCVISRQGVKRYLPLEMTHDEQDKFIASAQSISALCANLDD